MRSPEKGWKKNGVLGNSTSLANSMQLPLKVEVTVKELEMRMPIPQNAGIRLTFAAGRAHRVQTHKPAHPDSPRKNAVLRKTSLGTVLSAPLVFCGMSLHELVPCSCTNTTHAWNIQRFSVLLHPCLFCLTSLHIQTQGALVQWEQERMQLVVEQVRQRFIVSCFCSSDSAAPNTALCLSPHKSSLLGENEEGRRGETWCKSNEGDSEHGRKKNRIPVMLASASLSAASLLGCAEKSEQQSNLMQCRERSLSLDLFSNSTLIGTLHMNISTSASCCP